MSKQLDKQDTLELLENASREFTQAVDKATQKIEISYPNMLFQEKHTTGYLWKKKTHYRYFRYFEGTMLGVGITGLGTIRAWEKKL